MELEVLASGLSMLTQLVTHSLIYFCVACRIVNGNLEQLMSELRSDRL